MQFYCGVNETAWNYHPVEPGQYACISPVYGATQKTKRENRIKVPLTTQVVQDSGAFVDGLGERLSFEAAHERQIRHGEKHGYADQITHRASYDLLIDEVWDNGNRFKRRWTLQDAEFAVSETVKAAEFMAAHKDRPAVLSAQGVDAAQYLECVKQIIPLLDTQDVLGLGGWCIVGKMPKVMMPVFRETIRLVIPYAAENGVHRVHIWGVLYPRAIGELLWMCDQHEISLSTDSAGPTLKPVLGQWGYGDWIDKTYKCPPVEIRGLERARHVQATRDWLSHLRLTKYYREPKRRPVQLELWSV